MELDYLAKVRGSPASQQTIIMLTLVADTKRFETGS
jgi:hypothetical protein